MKKPPMKKKDIIIKIQIEDINDVSGALTMTANQLKNGTQYNEFTSGSAVVSVSMEFAEYTDFEEKEIDGVWYRIFKSRM